MPGLLPRFNADAQRLEDERKLGRILLEGAEVENVPGMPLRRSADGHNRDRRRGLPIISRAPRHAQTLSARCSRKRLRASCVCKPNHSQVTGVAKLLREGFRRCLSTPVSRAIRSWPLPVPMAFPYSPRP